MRILEHEHTFFVIVQHLVESRQFIIYQLWHKLRWKWESEDIDIIVLYIIANSSSQVKLRMFVLFQFMNDMKVVSSLKNSRCIITSSLLQIESF